MPVRILSAAICLALFIAAGCKSLEHQQLNFTAPVVVTRNGLYEPGAMVYFGADKIGSGGAPVTGDRLNGDRFTDFLGAASFSFGYNLEYDREDERFLQGARVVAWVEDSGMVYTDTAATMVPLQWPFGDCVFDTLRIELPAR